MMKRVDKNPIALLNEFGTRIKAKIEFPVNVKKRNRGQVFFCQVKIGGNTINQGFLEGESKQEARTAAAIDAIKILERDSSHRKEMVSLLERLEKKAAYQDENKAKVQPVKLTSIQDILKYSRLTRDEANILSILNVYAQNSRESLKWRIKNEGTMCLAEIHIGDLKASAMKNNKRQAKLYASKNLLKIIDSTNFLKNKFFYYLRSSKGGVQEPIHLPTKTPYEVKAEDQENSDREQVDDLSNNVSYPQEQSEEQFLASAFTAPLSLGDGFEDFEVLASHQDDSTYMKQFFEDLDKSIKPEDTQTSEMNRIFSEVSDLIKTLLPGGSIKIIPIGSYTLNCMRKDKLEIDSLLIDSSCRSPVHSPTSEVNLIRIKELFQERKGSFQLVNNHYQLYETQFMEDECTKWLYFTHNVTGIKLKIVGYNDKERSYLNSTQKVINYFNSTIYHALWLEKEFSKEPISSEVCKILRIVREWRDKNRLQFPSEILDLGVFYSTSSFKELDTIKVLMKFFALLNLLINNFNSYYYDLSEYHAYIIKVAAPHPEHEGRQQARHRPQGPADLRQPLQQQSSLLPVVRRVGFNNRSPAG